MAVGLLVGHPLAMLAHDFHEHLMLGTPLDVWGAFVHSFDLEMWPMTLLFLLFGGVSWGIIGLALKHLRENRLRLDSLHQEFEFQVATLRHHYKNLAIGIHGFSGRIKKKLADLDEMFLLCFSKARCPECPRYEEIHPDLEALERSFGVVEDASQRLIHTLDQEVMFLKALTSNSLHLSSRDFYPVLKRCIDELKELRFRDKEIQVQVDACDLEECSCSLIFPFEPYTMEVILQNIIGNAMKFAERIRIGVEERENKLTVAVEDDGPGFDVEQLRQHLLVPGNHLEAESTHLGIKVSLHLLEKYGGRLLAWSKPWTGSKFILEFPKRIPETW
ncbi:MAG: HAMP domain-containing histidine kinase [Deltaproteobacteria bacterium]|nr:HAMP domain-containing histidine kinase [Deltaproteobacteria bacterium]